MPREVLIVDNDPAVLAVIGQMLHSNFKGPIFFALTAVKARELWDDPVREIDLMVMDISFNGEGDDNLAAEYLRENPTGHVVIVSDWDLDTKAIARTGGQAVSVLRRPFSSEELLKAVLQFSSGANPH